ncbi:hypothetical protein KC19_VG055900 [Ceratodon purpureus]|uniref:Transmembrane protein n=1 Tax=Ceratodon purpureus TaxID=3225 RepID=A0A8T0HMN8_CERPU|nr:hypothetical protein KC19_VG055900 [Ceratodon purpureus]
MPFTRRPLQTTITFVALNGVLCLSLGPVYDFVCDLPFWERRRERLRQERELLGASQGVVSSEHN